MVGNGALRRVDWSTGGAGESGRYTDSEPGGAYGYRQEHTPRLVLVSFTSFSWLFLLFGDVIFKFVPRSVDRKVQEETKTTVFSTNKWEEPPAVKSRVSAGD